MILLSWRSEKISVFTFALFFLAQETCYNVKLLLAPHMWRVSPWEQACVPVCVRPRALVCVSMCVRECARMCVSSGIVGPFLL
jgi:hypothetical protein